jgi:hypothetical protein
MGHQAMAVKGREAAFCGWGNSIVQEGLQASRDSLKFFLARRKRRFGKRSEEYDRWKLRNIRLQQKRIEMEESEPR